MTTTTGGIDGADGTRLHYRAWHAQEPRAVLAVVHGLFEHSGRYEELGVRFAAAGITTFALDLRGHGKSDGRRAHVTRFRRFLDDVDRFLAHVRAETPAGLPRFLLGHSMGGLIGIRFLQERSPDLAGAVITSPWLGLARSVPGWQRALAGVANRIAPITPYPSGIDPAELSHDPERVADYRADPLIGSTLTIRLGLEVEAQFPLAFQRAHRIDTPLLFMIAGADAVVDADRGIALAESLDGDVTVRVLDGYYHEVLQESDRTAVMAEIRAWIEGRSR